jgi:hypothetical protein
MPTPAYFSRREAPSTAPPSTHCADHLANALHYRNYPWSLYAVFQTTITQWAFVLDVGLLVTFYLTLKEAGYYGVDGEVQPQTEQWQLSWFWGLFLSHFVFAKTIKLIPHLLRNPGDVRFIPVSVLFGYFHNLIKLYGCMTVTEVCSRTRNAAIEHAADFPTRQPGALVKAPTQTTTSGCSPSQTHR